MPVASDALWASESSSTWISATHRMAATIPTIPPRDVPARSLAAYVTELVHRLHVGEPALFRRLCDVVGKRRARISLDGESIELWFEGTSLIVADEPGAGPVDGEGGSDRLTTVELLAGHLDLVDAIVEGRLRATGDVESVSRIFQAIEILLDGSTRIPELRRLSLDYTAHTSATRRTISPSEERRVVIDPDYLSPLQRELLQRLDLLR